jgi:alpha-L-fucosidase 2
MNYWPAELCNLAECHEPLLEFVRELSENGARTARTNYGAAGWVAHHNSDIWRQSAPVGDYGHMDPIWSLWPMSAAWLCSHLWNHYEYGGDLGFLRDFAYPVMKGAAEFCLDWLVDDGKGRLTTAPSASPELRFVDPAGGTAALAPGATMDRALIEDLFADCERSARLLGVDADFADRLAAARARLRPYSIGARGQLLEWSEDFVESEEKHRHVSQLYGLFPGRSIDPQKMPDIAAAVRRSLELRGDASTGWSLGWKIALWSALGDGDRAYDVARLLLRPADPVKVDGESGGLYPNLFDACPPFQIDGNFAFTSGLAGMLLQSGGGELRLLPALPSAWPEGEVRGLRGRGGFEVGIAWKAGALVEATVLSRLGGKCAIRCARPALFREFDTEPDGEYRVFANKD